MNKNWIIGLVLVLALSGTVLADNNSTNNSTGTNVTGNDTETYGKALEVRYEHLICKVGFTSAQIELFDEYVATDLSGLEDSKETLNDYLEVLEGYVEDNNRTAFDKYLEETFRPEFNNVTRELNSLKRDFNRYNLSNSTRTEFIDDLKDLKEEYSDCVNDKELKMGRLMQRHMDNWNKQYMNNIRKMNRNGFNTTEMDAIIANMSARNAQLQALIESGNITKLKEFMEQYKEESMYFATKMEIEKLKTYKSRLDEESNKYNKTERVKNIDKHLEDAERYSQRHQGDDQDTDNETDEDYEDAWDNIKGANHEMKELSKEILRERAREHAPEGDRQGSGSGMNRGPRE